MSQMAELFNKILEKSVDAIDPFCLLAIRTPFATKF